MDPVVGKTFGFYEVLALAGSGGMGNVYRARDQKLGREVALKALPEEVARDQARLERFTLESRSASALNRPNIVTIFEIGEIEGCHYIAMELIEGKSLRDMLRDGALPVRRSVAIAAQIAEGLASAHARCIIHRDLKPENIMVTRSGLAKIVDFGLAKVSGVAGANETTLVIADTATTPGVVLGTVGYMSPEQASGRNADFRADQFSLGAILYEMLSGQRAFARPTAAQSLAAIISDEPPPLREVAPKTSVPLQWIVERCLSKDPDDRYGSTLDLAKELVHLRDATDSAASGVTPVPPRLTVTRLAIAAGIAIVIAVALFALGRLSGRSQQPKFQRLTFRRGNVMTARFAPEGKVIYYGAQWDGQPARVFATREEVAESSEVTLPAGDVLAVSKKGVVAIAIGSDYIGGFIRSGSLAIAPIGGGAAPREVLRDVQDADFRPDGSSLLVIHNVSATSIIEYPIGHELYRTAGWASHARISPDGETVAFIEHPLRGDDRGWVALLDTKGNRKVLTREWTAAQGLAWRPDGKEIWFTSADGGVMMSLRAVTPRGRLRTVYQSPARLLLHDIAGDGRVLLSSEQIRVGSAYKTANMEQDLSWLQLGFISDLSSDSRFAVISEQGEGAGREGSVYLRPTDGSPPIRISDGEGTTISPDGTSLLTLTLSQPRKVRITPLGAGLPREIEMPGQPGTPLHPHWLPDGKRIYYSWASGNTVRLYAQNIDGGRPGPISPQGYGAGLNAKPATPDGKWILASGPDLKLALVPSDGKSAPMPLPGSRVNEYALNFSQDGRYVFTTVHAEQPPRIYRIEVANGAREVWHDITIRDPAGVIFVLPAEVSADGTSYVFTYARVLNELFLAEGLR